MNFLFKMTAAVMLSFITFLVWAILDDNNHPEGDTHWVVYPYLDKKEG